MFRAWTHENLMAQNVFPTKDVLPKEYFFWLAGLTVLVLSNYKFQEIFNWPYRIALFITMVGFLACKNWKKIVIDRYFFLIFLALFFVGVHALAGHGDRIHRTFYYFIRSIPFFVLGAAVTRNRPFRNTILVGILVGYTLVACLDIYSVLTNSEVQGLIREQIAALTTGAQGEEEVLLGVNNLIYHFPTLVFVMFLSFSLYDLKSNSFKVFVLGCQSILLLTVLASTWTAAVILLTAGLVILVCLESSKRGRILPVVGLAVFLITVFVFYSGLTSVSEGGDMGKMTQRIALIMQNIADPGGMAEIADEISGTRLSLMELSVNEFLKAPLFGVGDFYFHERLGGHSFVADTFARYGLIGGVPLVVMLISWTWKAFKNYLRDPKGRMHTSQLTFFSVFLLGNVLNPYLFMATLDLVVFFAAGLTCGERPKLPQDRKVFRVATDSARP